MNTTVPTPSEARTPSASEPRQGRARRPRRRVSEPLPPTLAAAWDYTLIALGCLIVAGTFNVLLNGNRIVAGGLTGLSTILQGHFGIEPAVTQIVLNIPLFLMGTYFLGGRFGARTLVGILLMPLCVFFTRYLTPLTSNLLLASLYGGIGTGIGLGLLFKGGGSVGGTSLAAQLLSRLLGLSPGAALLLCDGLIIGAASLTLGPEKAMYGLISLFVTKRAIDVIQSGLSTSKLALIICRDESGVDAVRRAVIEEMDRGLTILSGSGGFTGRERPVLMVVVSQSEVSRLKAHVQAADPDAFVVLADADEVFGQGFKRYRL